jgi:hypothetical protein
MVARALLAVSFTSGATPAPIGFVLDVFGFLGAGSLSDASFFFAAIIVGLLDSERQDKQ